MQDHDGYSNKTTVDLPKESLQYFWQVYGMFSIGDVVIKSRGLGEGEMYSYPYSSSTVCNYKSYPFCVSLTSVGSGVFCTKVLGQNKPFPLLPSPVLVPDDLESTTQLDIGLVKGSVTMLAAGPDTG